jgi:hypothetical protein
MQGNQILRANTHLGEDLGPECRICNQDSFSCCRI